MQVDSLSSMVGSGDGCPCLRERVFDWRTGHRTAKGAFLVARPNGLQILGSANVQLETAHSSMCGLCRWDAASPVKALKSPVVAG
jgi:hypothetical protein